MASCGAGRRSKRVRRQAGGEGPVPAEGGPMPAEGDDAHPQSRSKRPRRTGAESSRRDAQHGEGDVRSCEKQEGGDFDGVEEVSADALPSSSGTQNVAPGRSLRRKAVSEHPSTQKSGSDGPVPCDDVEKPGVVLRLLLRDPSQSHAKRGGTQPLRRSSRASSMGKGEPGKVSPAEDERLVVTADPPPAHTRPSRVRRAPRKLFNEDDASSAGSVANAPPRSAKAVSAGGNDKRFSMPRKFHGQILSSQLRSKLNAMGPDERVSVCLPGARRLLAGCSAPSRKNLHSYFAEKPEGSVHIFDLDGAHKEWYAAPVEDAGEESVEDVEEESEEESEHAEDDENFVTFKGQRISRRLLQDINEMDEMERVAMWHVADKRVVKGTAAPRKVNLDDFLQRKSGYKFFDLYGRHKGCAPVRRRDKEREHSRDPPPTKGSSATLGHPLQKALVAAREKCVEIEKNVKSVLSSLRAGDPVAELRRELENEIDRVGGIAVVSKNMSEGNFLEIASLFLNELEDLNVFDMFESEDCDTPLGLPTIASIRVRLEAGEFIGTSDVWNEFCFALAYLLEFCEEGSAVYHEAERILYAGGRVRKLFTKEHAKLVSEEASLLRMEHICNSAFRVIEKKGLSLAKVVGLNGEGDGVEDGCRDSDLVEQQEAVVKHKSNYRDEKGHSYLGKQQSAKVISFALYRPGYDGQARLDSASSLGEGRFQHESACHFCSRKVDDFSSSALCCSNILYGMCRRIFCFQCATNKLGLSDEEFVTARAAEAWCCFHCRELCWKRIRCGKSGASEEISKLDVGVENVVIELPCASRSDCDSVQVKVARRKANGCFGEFGNPLNCSWRDDENRNCFSVRGVLRWGAYHCEIVLNGNPYASFCFQVLPSSAGSVEGDENETLVVEDALCTVRGPSFVKNDVIYAGKANNVHGNTMVRSSVIRTCLRWSVADEDRIVNEKDLPKSYHGSHIRTCSRTEGYDWRAAKLFPTVKWVGTPYAKVVHPCGRVDSAPLSVFHGSDSASMTSTQRWRGIVCPRISPGTLLSEYDVARNTAMYNVMRKRQWGIVTGKSSIHGIGLFTVSGYRKGDFVIEYAGELIRSQVGDMREVRYEAAGLGTYLFRLNDDHIVDATVESNRARFLNHSCDSNMQSRIVSIKDRDLVIFLATRHIPPMGELTFDYQLPLEEGKIQCRCNSPRCSGFMN